MNKCISLSCLIALVFIAIVSAQSPQISWSKAVGTLRRDYAESIQMTSDGGLIIAGGGVNTLTEGSFDAYVLRMNASGDTVWTRHFGDNRYEYVRSICQTADGGFIMVGTAVGYGDTNTNIYVLRMNAEGNTLWDRAYGGSGDDDGYSIINTFDGGFVIAGNTDSYGNGGPDAYVIKINAIGDTLWSRTFGGSNYDEAYDIIQTADSGFVFCGYSESYGIGGKALYLVRLNSHGQKMWSKDYGGCADDIGRSIRTVSNEGFIITGNTSSFGSQKQVYLVRIDTNGDTLWTRHYGGKNDDEGFGVVHTPDNGFVVAGYTQSFDSSDVYLIKTSSSGDTMWTLCDGGDSLDYARSLTQSARGDLYFAGYSNSSFVLKWTDVFIGSLQMHTIRTQADSNGTIDPHDTIRIYNGLNQQFTITPKIHCKLVDVILDDTSIGAVNACTLSTIKKDHTIRAIFADSVHAITASTADTNGAISPTGVISVKDNSNQTFSITPKAHKKIAAVIVDGTDIGPVNSFTFN
ncbi:MAG: hypothetical protein JW795_19990, partial [Chitinivibrionales bacterium]|nr:hypothetical protein [Chitinivibrionales bacterium]